MSLRWAIALGAVASVAALALLWPNGGSRAPTATAAPGAPGATPADQAPVDAVIVRFESGTAARERADARRRAGAELDESLPLPGLQLVDPEPGRSAAAVAARLERTGAVVYAEPDFERSIAAMPNDRYIGSQWGLHNMGQAVAGRAGTGDADIDAPEAWEIATGSAGIAVGVVDSGIDQGHPDLVPNLWRNPGENGGGRDSNGVDDDGNGLVDDWRGWDWVERDGDPSDPHGHGTHVAGTIGARGNDGAGVAGVAWQVGLVPLRVLDETGSGRVSDAISAYAYARRKQLRVVNASLGGSHFSQAERDALRAAADTLFVVAAGNDGVDNDATPTYPCNYDLANVICVAASDSDDDLAGFSNHGRTTVDLAAPGVAIASTWPGGGWTFSSGTSMATPHVAGAAALLWARAPNASVAEVRDALLEGVDVRPALVGRTVTGGRLDAQRSLAAVAGGEEAAGPSSEPSAPAPAAAPAPAPPPASASPPPPAPAQSAPPPSSGAPPSPAPVPALPSAPGVPSDATAPRVAVALRGRTGLRAALRRGIAVRTRCSESCTVRHRLLLARPTARRVGAGGPRDVLVGAARGGVATAGAVRMRVRLRRHARRRLARVRSARLVLTTRAVDAAGNAATARRTLRLRR